MSDKSRPAVPDVSGYWSAPRLDNTFWQHTNRDITPQGTPSSFALDREAEKAKSGLGPAPAGM